MQDLCSDLFSNARLIEERNGAPGLRERHPTVLGYGQNICPALGCNYPVTRLFNMPVFPITSCHIFLQWQQAIHPSEKQEFYIQRNAEKIDHQILLATPGPAEILGWEMALAGQSTHCLQRTRNKVVDMIIGNLSIDLRFFLLNPGSSEKDFHIRKPRFAF